MDPIDRLLADLAQAQIGTTFNPYRDSDPSLDIQGAATIRLGNLADHLRARPNPRLLLVGEAAGYAGCRFSGIAFTSERSLLPERRTSRDPRGYVEHSATIVHRHLRELDLEDETVLWNACPTHPADLSPLSNRTPVKDELAAGRPFLVRLMSILQPAVVVAVGVHAARALPRLAAVRHPANGGAAAFRAGLAAVVGPAGRSRLYQPSQKDGLGRMCKTHWNQYTNALRKAALARKAAEGGVPPDAADRMAAHDLPLVRRQGPRLEQDPVGHVQLADIVKHR